MITHNPTFEDLAKAPVKQTDVIVARQILDESGFIDGDQVYSSSDVLMEVKIDIVGEMLGTVTKKATARTLGILDEVAVGDTYQVRLGIYDTNLSSFNYISQGFYLVDSIDYDYEAGSTTIVMYDYMWKADKTLYIEAVPADSLEYPLSVQDLALEMANLLNIDLMADFEDLPNADYEIQEDLYTDINGTTLRNVIQDIAGATGTTARITDTTLVFSQYDPTDENLNSNELKTLKIGETYGPVTSVVLGRVPQNDNIAITSANPSSFIVTNVNTSTNLLTIDDHGMKDGNLIYFSSTNTLPAPLVTTRGYYVYTNAQEDTFALALTYDDAIAGTNLVDLTTLGSGTIAVNNVVIREIQINNNEILDDERETVLPPLYNELSGIYWTDVAADSVGLGWHEVGDVISFTQGLTTVRAFLNEIHLTLAGSIKERLVSKIPKVAAIDYTASGGITRTLYNTEIKVDKQNQQITSVVSQINSIEGQINEDFTQINQDVDDVLITIQKAGGGNLLLNSVGYAKEQATDDDDVNYARLVSWDYPIDYAVADHGTVTSYDSSDSQNAGGLSGRVIQFSGDYLVPKTVSIEQRVNVAVGVPMSFGMLISNPISQGEATVTIYNDNESFSVTVDDTANRVWEEFSIINFVATQPWIKVKIESTSNNFRVSDLRLLYGTTLQGWVQSNAEILAANVQFSKDGMRIFNDSNDTETRVSYNEFAVRRRSDSVVLFEADDTGVVTNDLTIRGSTSFSKNGDVIIKQITIAADNPKAGIAFVLGADV